MSIKDWPRLERPREKLLHSGVAQLSDAELLAILLARGVRGRDVLQIARDVLAQCGGLSGLAQLEKQHFCRFHGLSELKYAVFHAALELSRRSLLDQVRRGAPITDAASAQQFLIAELAPRQREVFCGVFLDTRNRVIAFEILFEGTIDNATVHPREVIKRVLELNAQAVIFAHNHPSGVCEPSRADKRLTERLRSALDLIDVRLLDHVVVAGRETVSFAELGLLY